MRWTAPILAGIALSAAALAMPPYANELMLPTGGIAAEKSTPPKAVRGQYIGVACANVELAKTEGIQVVLYMMPGETPTGYRGVLALDQQVTKGAVHVRVPDAPDFADHTVYVRVYYSDRGGRHYCDGGKVRIV